jgi:cytochrome P450
VSDFDGVDFFTDESLVADPYPYLEYLRESGPVVREPHHGVVAVTGHDEAVAVYNDTAAFSSCNTVTGPFPGLPVEPTGDDIGALIEQYRDQLPMYEHLVTFDPPAHTDHRALLMRLITPKRLKENEAFMWELADRQLDELLSERRCEFIKEYAQPFAMLVVADLLGVPQADHELFRERLGAQRPGDIATTDDEWSSSNPLEFLDTWFSSYVEDRRRAPRDDVLSGLANATFPDGSTPDVLDVVRIATFLFAAGQETTARLLSSALQLIAENPDIQQRLRDERDLIPNFVEEVLRMESPVKSDFRMARRTTTLGGVDVAAGTTVMMLNGAANRDPRRFECPHEFQVDRANARQHIAFGHGIHTCPGAPLARAETRISLERIFDRMADIRISESEHGPASARHYDYEPTYILRGLSNLHLEFTPIDDAPEAVGATR